MESRSSARSRGSVAALIAVLEIGCRPTIQPRYPHPEVARRAEEVASISGPIASIDEEPVSSRGTIFQTLPGCHVVRLMERVGELNAEGTQGFAAHLPPTVFAPIRPTRNPDEIQACLRWGNDNQPL